MGPTMRIGHWPARRILLIWAAVLVYMASYVLITPNRSSTPAAGAVSLAWLGSLPTDSALTPTQRATKDSLLKVLGRIAQDSVAQATTNRLMNGFNHAFDGIGLRLLVKLAVFLGPALMALALTALWLLSKRRIVSEAGA